MAESRFASLLRADLGELRAYEPRQGSFEVRLDANEAPPLLSADASQRLTEAMSRGALTRYPDARATELRAAIAARVGTSPEEVLVGVGSDEVIALLLTALDRPRPGASAPSIVAPSPTFAMYRMSARARGFRVVEVPLDASWDLDVGGMKRAIDLARPNLVFLATPNNPTSRSLSLDRIEAIIVAASDALVVIDEAYVDFAAQKQAHLLRAYPNVALLRTLSKVGFAALRTGFLAGPADLVAEVDKVRQPYNLPTAAQLGATFVLRELREEVDRVIAAVIAERNRLAGELARRGFGVTPSDANFLWVEVKGPAGELTEALAARGVLIKSFHASGGRLARRVRITIGTPAENARLLDEIDRCAAAR
jgi:histidinol-phosphate aminotransferase